MLAEENKVNKKTHKFTIWVNSLEDIFCVITSMTDFLTTSLKDAAPFLSKYI